MSRTYHGIDLSVYKSIGERRNAEVIDLYLRDNSRVTTTNDAIAASPGAALDNLAYVTVGNTGSLSAERALAASSPATLSDGGGNSSVTIGVDVSDGSFDQFLRSNTSDSYTSGTLTFASGTTVNIADGATFNFDRVTSTSPFTVDSTTVVANLNADTVDAIEGAEILQRDGSVPLTADWDAGSFEIRAQTLESDVATGTAPLTIASTTVVANLNVATLDDSGTGVTASQFLRSDEDDTGTGTYRLTAAIPISLRNGSSRTIAFGQAGVSETLNITGDGTVVNTINLDNQFALASLAGGTTATLAFSSTTTATISATAGDLALTSTSDDIILTSGNDITLTAGSGNIQTNDIVTLAEGAFLADADIIRFGNTSAAFDVSLSWETEGTDSLQLKPRTNVDVNLKIGSAAPAATPVFS